MNAWTSSARYSSAQADEPWVRDSYGKADFTESCLAHDACYGTCGATKDSWPVVGGRRSQARLVSDTVNPRNSHYSRNGRHGCFREFCDKSSTPASACSLRRATTRG